MYHACCCGFLFLPYSMFHRLSCIASSSFKLCRYHVAAQSCMGEFGEGVGSAKPRSSLVLSHSASTSCIQSLFLVNSESSSCICISATRCSRRNDWYSSRYDMLAVLQLCVLYILWLLQLSVRSNVKLYFVILYNFHHFNSMINYA